MKREPGEEKEKKSAWGSMKRLEAESLNASTILGRI